MIINPTFNGQWTDEQKAKMNQAIDLWAKVWASDAFKQKVLSSWFTQTKDNAQTIYTNIMRTQPKQMIYSVNQVANGSETASTNTTTGETTIQILWLQNCSVLDLVGTLSHESTHTPAEGAYTHSYYGCWPWRNRIWSVPYYIQNITIDLASKL
jgi:hypothetical protein